MANNGNVIQETKKFLELPYWEIYAQRVLAGHEIRGGQWTMQTRIPMEIDALVMTIMGLLASYPVKQVDICYPADWWEASKERWFPGWLLRRWPVEYIKHHYDARYVFPDMEFPKILGRSVKIIEYSGPQVIT